MLAYIPTQEQMVFRRFREPFLVSDTLVILPESNNCFESKKLKSPDCICRHPGVSVYFSCVLLFEEMAMKHTIYPLLY